MSDARTLTISEVQALGTIVDGCARGAVAQWVDDYSGEVVSGVLRHIVRDCNTMAFAHNDVDVRDCYVRITTGGFEWTPTVSQIVTKIQANEFVVDR
jgi:hypothetical protein